MKKLFSLTEPLGPPSPDAPLSEINTMSVLSSSTGLLEVVDQAAGLVVGIGAVTGIHLGHAAKSLFSSSDSESQGRTRSSAGKGLPSYTLQVGHRVHR